MQVSSRTNSFNQAPRPSSSDRKSSEQDLNGGAAKSRRGDAITGSEAVLSKSLADALWAIQRSSDSEDNAVVGTVEDVYRAYAA